MSQQPAQQADLMDHQLVKPSTRQRQNRFKSKANLGGYQPRTLQRVSVTKWEADADLEQGLEEDRTSSVSLMLYAASVTNMADEVS